MKLFPKLLLSLLTIAPLAEAVIIRNLVPGETLQVLPGDITFKNPLFRYIRRAETRPRAPITEIAPGASLSYNSDTPLTLIAVKGKCQIKDPASAISGFLKHSNAENINIADLTDRDVIEVSNVVAGPYHTDLILKIIKAVPDTNEERKVVAAQSAADSKESASTLASTDVK